MHLVNRNISPEHEEVSLINNSCFFQEPIKWWLKAEPVPLLQRRSVVTLRDQVRSRVKRLAHSRLVHVFGNLIYLALSNQVNYPPLQPRNYLLFTPNNTMIIFLQLYKLIYTTSLTNSFTNSLNFTNSSHFK